MGSGKVLVWAGVAALVACSSAPKISDTGYVGTWGRGNDRARSTIAIVKDGDGYRFRWQGLGDSGGWRVTCGWDGSCKEFARGELIATYIIQTSVDPGTGRLRVTTTRTGTSKSPGDNVDVDEIVVESGGKVLRSYVVQRNEQRYEAGKGSTRLFDKISDRVDDPPSTSTN